MMKFLNYSFILIPALLIQFTFAETDSTESVAGDEPAETITAEDDEALLAEIAALTGGDEAEEVDTEQESSGGGSGLGVSFSGYNLLQAAYGFSATTDPDRRSFFFTDDSLVNLEQYENKIIRPDPYLCIPWYYVQNLFDFSLGVGNFSLNSRFKIDEPSMGIVENKDDMLFYRKGTQFYQEFFDKRTLAYSGEHLTIQTGHFQTTLGRGLTLNLSENENVDKTNLLDGLHLSSDLEFLSVEAFIGRDKINKMGRVAVLSFDMSTGLIDTGFTNIENKTFSNTIFGLHGESYLFSYIPLLDFMSASSIGGGVTNFRSEVDSIRHIETVFDPSDSTVKNAFLFYQDRRNSVLPSGFLNFSVGDFSWYFEYAHLVSNLNKVTLDNNNYLSDTIATSKGYNLYTSLSAELGKLYVLLEGINYWYARESAAPYLAFGPWVDPPEGRYKQKWHLLNKVSVKGKPEDQVGYNMEVNYNLSDNTKLFGAYSQNGKHAHHALFYSHMKVWETYFEWDQNIKNILHFNTGIQFGHSEWNHPDVSVLTYGLRTDLKPFGENHLFGLEFEFQRKSRDYSTIIQSLGTLKSELQTFYDQNSIPILADTLPTQQVIDQHNQYVGSISFASNGTSYNNLFASISYSFSSLFSCKFLFEQESRIVPEYRVNFADDTEPHQRFYKALILGTKPTDKLDFELGIGSFSERDECSPAGCVIVPAFKGIKLTMNTIF